MFHNRENEQVTLPDGRVVWLSRSCAVITAIFADVHKEGHHYSRSVLLTKRGPACPDNVGRWVMPCGYLDFNETLSDAAEREVYEETGLYLKAMPDYNRSSLLIGQPVFVNSNWSPESKQNVSNFFTIKLRIYKHPSPMHLSQLPDLDLTKVKNPGEVEEMRWVPLQEVCNYDLAFGHGDRIKQLSNLTR